MFKASCYKSMLLFVDFSIVHMFLAEFLKVGLDKTFRSDLKTIFLHSTMNGGFIIKCRDIPAVNTSLELKHDFTDHIAFYATVDQPFCDGQYPNSTTSFCHVTLKHSIDGFRIGPEGLVTHITSRVGHRAYLLARKKGQCSLSDLHKPLIEWLPDESWSIEIVLVAPGSTMYALCSEDFPR